MKTLKVRYAEGAKEIEIPRVGDVGIDLYAAEDMEITPGNAALVSTGISIQPPEGHWLQIVDRSSVSKYCHVMAGVIDETYTGEIRVRMFCHKSNGYVEKEVMDSDYLQLPSILQPIGGQVSYIRSNVPVFKIQKGDKIAQLIIRKNYNREFQIEEVKELSNTERGSGGFGSTGKE